MRSKGCGCQDIYKWVTHEKGILGSQGTYNKRHRQLCQPPFRNPALLSTFANVIVRRWGPFLSRFCCGRQGSSVPPHCRPPRLVPHVPRSLCACGVASWQAMGWIVYPSVQSTHGRASARTHTHTQAYTHIHIHTQTVRHKHTGIRTHFHTHHTHTVRHTHTHRHKHMHTHSHSGTHSQTNNNIHTPAHALFEHEECGDRRTYQLADIWAEHQTFTTDVAVQTQRLTLDVVGLVAFSHDFGQTERIRRSPAPQTPNSCDIFLQNLQCVSDGWFAHFAGVSTRRHLESPWPVLSDEHSSVKPCSMLVSLNFFQSASQIEVP